MVIDVDKIKPKEKWVYCRDVVGNNYLVFEDSVYFNNKKIKFEEPVLAVSVDVHIALRAKTKVVVLNKDGKVIWEKKIKSSAICHKSEYIAIARKKKLIVFDLSGKKLFSKKIKGKILSIDLGENIIVGSEKGIHAISYSGKLNWELYIGRVTLVKSGIVIVVAKENELLVLSAEGEILWRQKFNNIIYDVYITDKITIYLFGGDVITLSLDGKILEIKKEEYEFKFLPMPWITVGKELERLNSMIKEAKKLKPKSVKKLAKKAKKLYKKEFYGEAYELILEAYRILKDIQLQVILPKLIISERPTTILFKFHNFFDEVLDEIEVDITDLEKYFDIPEGIFTLPPLRKNTFIEKRVSVKPKYEGLFIVEINIKSNFGDIQKRFRVRVRKAGFLTKLFVREKERSLVDLIR